MNKDLHIRIDDETLDLLEKLKKELKITKSDIIRMALNQFNNYVKKASK